MKRTEIFARDDWTCVYCGLAGSAESLSIDHVQPRTRGGDDSGGNVVTACLQCNALKGSRSLTDFLVDFPDARRNFLSRARYVWPRHLQAVAEELVRRGVALTGPDFVEGVRGLHGSDATASVSPGPTAD